MRDHYRSQNTERIQGNNMSRKMQMKSGGLHERLTKNVKEAYFNTINK